MIAGLRLRGANPDAPGGGGDPLADTLAIPGIKGVYDARVSGGMVTADMAGTIPVTTLGTGAMGVLNHVAGQPMLVATDGVTAMPTQLLEGIECCIVPLDTYPIQVDVSGMDLSGLDCILAFYAPLNVAGSRDVISLSTSFARSVTNFNWTQMNMTGNAYAIHGKGSFYLVRLRGIVTGTLTTLTGSDDGEPAVTGLSNEGVVPNNLFVLGRGPTGQGAMQHGGLIGMCFKDGAGFSQSEAQTAAGLLNGWMGDARTLGDFSGW